MQAMNRFVYFFVSFGQPHPPQFSFRVNSILSFLGGFFFFSVCCSRFGILFDTRNVIVVIVVDVFFGRFIVYLKEKKKLVQT